MASEPATPSTSTPSTETHPKISPKKKGKKKKVKPVIPKNLTANLGETQKKERESDPEVFEKVTKPKPKGSATKSDESNSGSAESLTKSVSTSSAQSLSKLSPRPSKCIHDDAQDKTIEYKIDVGRTYSQSSGTLSYDSVFVADESKVNTFRAIGIAAKPADVKVQNSKVTDLNALKHLEQTATIDDEKYQKLVYGNECPRNAAPTPEYLLGRREQQLTKDAIMEALDEYFAIPRDDMDLTIRVQRHQRYPILDMKITPNPRTNYISTLSTSDAGASEYSTTSSTSVDPEGCLND